MIVRRFPAFFPFRLSPPHVSSIRGPLESDLQTLCHVRSTHRTTAGPKPNQLHWLTKTIQKDTFIERKKITHSTSFSFPSRFFFRRVCRSIRSTCVELLDQSDWGWHSFFFPFACFVGCCGCLYSALLSSCSTEFVIVVAKDPLWVPYCSSLIRRRCVGKEALLFPVVRLG